MYGDVETAADIVALVQELGGPAVVGAGLDGATIPREADRPTGDAASRLTW
ncbi:MAG TPA: hypothetical protein VND54_09350 [Candidatus Saccharimonadales bacterium]|nr:hypothetical protein [Candidatus Saccharimonadales bacterium]